MPTILDRFRDLLSPEAVSIEPGEEPQPLGAFVRFTAAERGVHLDLGGAAIVLNAESGGATHPHDRPGCWRIGDAGTSGEVLCGCMRLHPGELALVGRDDERSRALFGLADGSPMRHLELRNDAGSLLVRNLAPDRPCAVSVAEPALSGDRLCAARRDSLAHLSALLGGRIELLRPDEALACAAGVLEVLRDEPHRPKDASGRPGGLLEPPTGAVPIIVGDLHGELDNLLRVLCEPNCLPALERGDAYLLLLGDTVHREATEELEEMDSSLLMLDFICRLKLRFPGAVGWLRGNHESFGEHVGKGGVQQGTLLRRAARRSRGDAYADAIEALFEMLPHVARTDDFVACHAGPPPFAADRSAIIAIADHPELAEQLVWARPRRRGQHGGFGKRDVARFCNGLGATAEAPLIVGHTPQSDEGVVWTDVAGIPGCHVIYNSRSDGVPVFTRLRSAMTWLEFEAQPLTTLANARDRA